MDDRISWFYGVYRQIRCRAVCRANTRAWISRVILEQASKQFWRSPGQQRTISISPLHHRAAYCSARASEYSLCESIILIDPRKIVHRTSIYHVSRIWYRDRKRSVPISVNVIPPGQRRRNASLKETRMTARHSGSRKPLSGRRAYGWIHFYKTLV